MYDILLEKDNTANVYSILRILIMHFFV